MTAHLRHLRVFVAVADAGSLTRAAAALHLSQPAVTRTLQQLEAHLGARLADRDTHRLELTRAGTELLARARAALAAVDDALDPARLAVGPLRLGHAWSALGPHTTTLLRRWRHSHPDTPLELLRIDERDAGLGTGRVDVAVLRDTPPPGSRSTVVATEPRVAAVPADDPLATRDTVTLAELATHPVAVNTVSGTTTPGLWPADHRPAHVVEVANTDDWLATIAAGLAVGVTTTATPVLHHLPGVAFVGLADAPPVEVRLVWHDPPTHPAVGELVAVVGEVMRGAGGAVG